MRSSSRLPVRIAWLVTAALFLGTAHADDTVAQLRAIVQQSVRVLEEMSRQVRELSARSMESDSTAASGSRVIMGAGKYTLIDLQRSAREIADLGNEANARMTRCEKGVKRIGRDFQTQTRRLSTMANRMMSSREVSGTTSTLGEMDFAIQRAYGLLPAIGNVTECISDEQAGTGDDSADEKKDKKKDNKGTEDYDE